MSKVLSGLGFSLVYGLYWYMDSGGHISMFIDPIILGAIILISLIGVFSNGIKSFKGSSWVSIISKFGKTALLAGAVCFFSDLVVIFANMDQWSGETSAGIAVSLIGLVYGSLIFTFCFSIIGKNET